MNPFLLMATSDTPTSLEDTARELAAQASEQIKTIFLDLLRQNVHVGENLQLECSLSGLLDHSGTPIERFRVASVGLDRRSSPSSWKPRDHTTSESVSFSTHSPSQRASKRRKPNSGLTPNISGFSSDVNGSLEVGEIFAKTTRVPDNPALQPSSLEKYIGGVWDSIYGGIKLNPSEVIEQWQAIELGGQPRLPLLADTEKGLASRDRSLAQGNFERMSVLTRKIFDDRVAELTHSITKEKAKKQTIAEACVEFSWSEKELRNKMAIWRGYHDIQKAAGYAALVFAGSGLYRFCKYRVSFTDETFGTLKALRHRFEVAADTIHPHWRQLLSVIGESAKQNYAGHPHDWVVAGPGNEAIPLPSTYHQWDRDFNYTHLEEPDIDVEVFGDFDPREVSTRTTEGLHVCDSCGELQSDDPKTNHCGCFTSLYGPTKSGYAPVQVFRTPDGKNNGLIACCAFETGTAVGEFVGQITKGLANMDVMVGQTDQTTYQIWQGRRGNHTRFINHSCRPNSEYERFVWLGLQRIVLVSKGIKAGEEVTVDYSDTYWKDLDKVCLCGHADCRYSDRVRILPLESS
ncbi:hypothetical protein LTS12_019136 [Elasticomyces elasticus]|nr:hypothetical protein LTS12_019136 [Elasticomyces elasticus]